MFSLLKTGDKVIVRSNDLFNGELGTVHKIQHDHEMEVINVFVKMEEDNRIVPFEDPELELVPKHENHRIGWGWNFHFHRFNRLIAQNVEDDGFDVWDRYQCKCGKTTLKIVRW